MPLPVVVWIAFAVAAVGGPAACSKPDAALSAPDPRPPTPPEWDRVVTRLDEAAAADMRASCAFKRGALPDETLGRPIPTGKDIPLETIVVLMQENRSFDHYFARFGRYANRTDVEVAPETATNPDRTGPVSSAAHAFQRAGHSCFLDTAHTWTKTHQQINGGKMDGFYETNHDIVGEVMTDPTMALRDGERALWWYDERDIPFYYALAKSFGIGDHYFASVAGPTWPNRMYLYAATSFGLVENSFPNVDAYPFPDNDAVILDELVKRHVDFKVYSDGPPAAATVLSYQFATRWDRETKLTMSDFFADAEKGALPPVVFIDPNALESGRADRQDEHPPADLQVGVAWVRTIVGALMKSPQWAKLALFLIYDEHGGLYDHLPPPPACVPDDKTPVMKGGAPAEGAFDTYGVRVPMIVVSPYARRGYVGHGVYDHTSVLRFIQAKHRLPALTARDANAAIPSEFFDFAGPPDLTLPELPAASVESGELDYCRQTFEE